MSKAAVLILLLTLLLGGCIHYQDISLDRPHRFNRLNREAQKRPVNVTLRDGTRLQVHAFFAEGDSASWSVDRDAYVVRFALADIDQVEYVRYDLGALEMMGAGAFALGAGLAIYGFMVGDDPPSEELFELSWSAEEKARRFGVLGAIVGGLIGIPVGAQEGTRIVYRFKAPPASEKEGRVEGGP